MGVALREKWFTDQKKLRIRTLFTQCRIENIFLSLKSSSRFVSSELCSFVIMWFCNSQMNNLWIVFNGVFTTTAFENALNTSVLEAIKILIKYCGRVHFWQGCRIDPAFVLDELKDFGNKLMNLFLTNIFFLSRSIQFCLVCFVLRLPSTTSISIYIS